MKSLNSLPENYKEIFNVNIQKNKKVSFIVNGFSILIMLFMLFITFLNGYWIYFFALVEVYKIIALVLLMILYIVLHELTHGIAMKICGTKKIKYGFTGLYGYAGSDDFYDKKSYIFIALAPVVLWGVVLLIVNFIVPIDWFYIVYLLQVFNISGAAGDFYVTYKFSKMPKDILVLDDGVGMTVYSKTE